MPKIKYSALVNTIRGRLEGSVLSQCRGVNYLKRHHAHPRQPHSAAQQNIRGILNDLSGQWYALPQVKKDLWQAYASMLPRPMTGLNAHNSLNLALIRYLGSAYKITTPPPTPSTPPAAPSVVITQLADGKFRFHWSSPSSASIFVIGQYTFFPGRRDLSTQRWKLISCTRSDIGYMDTPTGYPDCTDMAFRFRCIDLYGRLSPWSHVRPRIVWEKTVESGCVLYLPFSEGEGETTYDISGEGNDGTIYGASWVTGKREYGLSFDGSNDSVDCGTDEILNLGTDDFTLEVWVKTGVIPPGWDAWFYAKEAPDDTGAGIGIRGSSDTTNKGKIDFGPGCGLQYHGEFFGTTSIADNKWHHIVGTADRDGLARIYLDGQQETTRNISSASGVSNDNTNSAQIGCRRVGGFFSGLIDEVRVYNRELGADEILAHYLAERETHCAAAGVWPGIYGNTAYGHAYYGPEA